MAWPLVKELFCGLSCYVMQRDDTTNDNNIETAVLLEKDWSHEEFEDGTRWNNVLFQARLHLVSVLYVDHA